ncbi:MAG TPA: CvpA family protein, partial [Verrucomicrobiota bacterium]|nr:CvpA family protein [Verrucomicrobiota bacterium]
MSFSQLPINVFDVVVIAMLGLGIYKGRKYGMSEELLRLLKWLAIVFGCAFIYEPAGRMLGQYTTLLGRLSCYVLAYVGCAVLIVLLFAGIQRLLGGKLVGSDVFGRAEYYLGMGSGMVRLGCILLAALALLNARYFSPTEV